jgi:hypothetical protein
MESLLGWFDLGASALPLGPAAGSELSLPHQLLLYLVVLLGVVMSEAVAMARAGVAVRIELDRAWLLVACLVALVVFPAVWREIGTLAESGLLVQAGIAAQGGVFWGVVLAGAEKGVRARAEGEPGARTDGPAQASNDTAPHVGR